MGPRPVNLTGEELAALAKEVVSRGGRLWFVATGHSMQPIIQPGDAVLVGPLRPGGAKPGDIILVRRPNETLLHRVLARREARGVRAYVTRGDASAVEEESPADAVIARVLKVHRPFQRWLDARFVRAVLRQLGFCRGRGQGQA